MALAWLRTHQVRTLGDVDVGGGGVSGGGVVVDVSIDSTYQS